MDIDIGTEQKFPENIEQNKNVKIWVQQISSTCNLQDLYLLDIINFILYVK